MKYGNTVIPLLVVLLVGLVAIWNLGNTEINRRLLNLPMIKSLYSRPIEANSPNETATRILYGDGTCGSNVHRESLKKLLKWWVPIANEHNINYTLMFGSLIGAHRDYDVIPWDHDIDIAVNYPDILTLGQLAEPRNFDPNDGKVHMSVIPKSQHDVPMDNRKRYTCRGEETPTRVDQCSIQEPLIRVYHHWTFLDIFSYVDNGGEFLTFIHEYNKDKFRRTDVFPLKSCSLLGFLCKCAKNSEVLLEYQYGTGFLKPMKKCRNKSWIPA